MGMRSNENASSKSNDLANGLTRGERIHRGINFLQRDRGAVEQIDGEQASLIHRDETRYVALGDARAHVGSLERALLGDE